MQFNPLIVTLLYILATPLLIPQFWPWGYVVWGLLTWFVFRVLGGDFK